MAKKRGKKVKAAKNKNIVPKVVNAEKAVEGKISNVQKKVVEEAEDSAPLFSRFLKKNIKPKSKYRKKEERDLRRIRWRANDLVVESELEKVNKTQVPIWFYISSIFAAFLFTTFISVYATIHFENIAYMNITIVFFFIAMVSYFLIASVFFISEKRKWHAAAPTLFFIGIVCIMIYAFRAIDTSDLVRYSIIYTIIVAAISSYVLAIRRR